MNLNNILGRAAFAFEAARRALPRQARAVSSHLSSFRLFAYRLLDSARQLDAFQLLPVARFVKDIAPHLPEKHFSNSTWVA